MFSFFFTWPLCPAYFLLFFTPQNAPIQISKWCRRTFLSFVLATSGCLNARKCLAMCHVCSAAASESYVPLRTRGSAAYLYHPQCDALSPSGQQQPPNHRAGISNITDHPAQTARIRQEEFQALEESRSNCCPSGMTQDRVHAPKTRSALPAVGFGRDKLCTLHQL